MKPNTDSLLAKPELYYGAALLFVIMGLVQRLATGLVPGDMSAYLSAADLYAAGLDPYTAARFSAPRYDGFPYNYFPGTLPVIAWLAFMPTWLAVALDWCARSIVLFLSLRWLNRKINGGRNLHYVVGLALIYEPLLVDWMVGNMVTYLLGAWVLSAALADQERSKSRLAMQLLAGLLLAFKPFWFLPVGWVLLVKRRWDLMAALVAGGGVMAALTLGHPQLIETFLPHTQKMRGFYYSVDLLNLYPPALFVAAAVVVGAGAMLWYKRTSPELWLLGCLCMPIFPRLATYSYVLALPFVIWLFREFRPLKAFVLSGVVIGPLPWILRESAFLPGERVENWVLFGWSWVAMIAFYAYLWRADVSRPRTS